MYGWPALYFEICYNCILGAISFKTNNGEIKHLTANSKAGKFLRLKLCVKLLHLIEFHQKKQYFSSNPDFEKPVGT